MLVAGRRCEICGELVEFDVQRCDECCNNLSKIDGDICILCGHKKKDCTCKKHKKEYKGIVAPYYYDEKLYQALHRFKFSKYVQLADGMGKDMAKCVQDRYADIQFDCITYVPLSWLKLDKRGYNQSELLSNVMSQYLNLPVEQLLVKKRHTKSQRTSKSYQERTTNLYGAFELSKNAKVSGKTILLVDDVKTTGSTLNECAKMLNIYGAEKVYAVTFAITKSRKK